MKISVISLLISRQFREQNKIYGLSLLVLFGMLSFLFLIIHQWQDSFSGAVQNGVFIIGLFIGGGIFTNSMFHELSSSPSSIWLLCLPAKASEKVIASIVLSVVFFLIAYLIIFYLVDVLYLLKTDRLEMEYLLNPIKENFYIFFFWYLLYNGAILLGRVVFGKYSLIKTILVGILFFVAFNYLNNLMLELLIPNIKVVSSIPFDSFQFVHQGENIQVFLPRTIDIICSFFTRILLPILMWFFGMAKAKRETNIEMKTSNILLSVVLFLMIFGMFFTNVSLKSEYSKIDLRDPFKNYISYDVESYSVINIEGSNGYPIEIKKGKVDDIKVLRSREKHFRKKLVGDTLFIEFTGANIPIQQAFISETPPGIIIEKNTLTKIIVSNTYNRITLFSEQELDVLLKNTSVADIADCHLKRLTLHAESKSQFVFSRGNKIDSLNLTMLDKSVGHLNDLEFSNLHQSLEDSVTLVLSKKVFDRISNSQTDD